MKEQIWNYIARLDMPGFFITAEIVQEGSVWPDGLESFIIGRLDAIRQEKITARKFIFAAYGWRIHFTFFPTDRVVDERYALKNKMIKRKNMVPLSFSK